jgi:hypothetical protein
MTRNEDEMAAEGHAHMLKMFMCDQDKFELQAAGIDP